MLCQCIVAYFSYNMQTPQGECVTDPEKKKKAFYQIIRQKKKGSLETNIKIIYLNAQYVSVYLIFSQYPGRWSIGRTRSFTYKTASTSA